MADAAMTRRAKTTSLDELFSCIQLLLNDGFDFLPFTVSELSHRLVPTVFLFLGFFVGSDTVQNIEERIRPRLTISAEGGTSCLLSLIIQGIVLLGELLDVFPDVCLLLVC